MDEISTRVENFKVWSTVKGSFIALSTSVRSMSDGKQQSNPVFVHRGDEAERSLHSMLMSIELSLSMVVELMCRNCCANG